MASAPRDTLRRLAEQVAALATESANGQRRELWTRHNVLEKVRPPVLVRLNCWSELLPADAFAYRDGLLHDVEFALRQTLYNATLGDDSVVEPVVTVPMVYGGPPLDELWGVPMQLTHPEEDNGAWGFNPPLREYDDLAKLQAPPYIVDEAATAERVAQVEAAIGDIITIQVDYSGPIGITASLGQTATALRGFQQLMVDVLDNPEWVHAFMRLLMEAHLAYLREMERQGRVTANHTRWPFYSAPLCEDYDPARVRLCDCWGYGESQEFDLFSPEMMDEFLLAYQLPIFRLTTFNHYGCCENLTHKYPLLEKIPGLRRVSVSPWTDFATAVETTAGRHALNWRYTPSEVIFNFDPDTIRRTIRRHLEIARDVPVEIILQDIETVNGHPEYLREWTRIAVEEAERSVSAGV
jgi:hypothetical protein